MQVAQGRLVGVVCFDIDFFVFHAVFIKPFERLFAGGTSVVTVDFSHFLYLRNENIIAQKSEGTCIFLSGTKSYSPQYFSVILLS